MPKTAKKSPRPSRRKSRSSSTGTSAETSTMGVESATSDAAVHSAAAPTHDSERATPSAAPVAMEVETGAGIEDAQERLLHALYEAQLDLDELARRERWSLQRLAEWANDSQTAQALEGLCRLNDARAQMLVGRYRTLAAAKLFELASRDDGGELARKSCVDLLKVSLVALADHQGSSSAAPAPLDDALALALMRRISATSLETSTSASTAPTRRPPLDERDGDPAGDDETPDRHGADGGHAN